MAGGATVHPLQPGQQHLSNRDLAPQYSIFGRGGRFLLRFQAVKLVLICFPGWTARLPDRGNQQDQNQQTETEEEFWSAIFHYWCPATGAQGGVKAHPGPRK